MGLLCLKVVAGLTCVGYCLCTRKTFCLFVVVFVSIIFEHKT